MFPFDDVIMEAPVNQAVTGFENGFLLICHVALMTIYGTAMTLPYNCVESLQILKKTYFPEPAFWEVSSSPWPASEGVSQFADDIAETTYNQIWKTYLLGKFYSSFILHMQIWIHLLL